MPPAMGVTKKGCREIEDERTVHVEYIVSGPGNKLGWRRDLFESSQGLGKPKGCCPWQNQKKRS
jgi:hypothetical protein